MYTIGLHSIRPIVVEVGRKGLCPAVGNNKGVNKK